MQNILKIISISYLVLITILFLMPLDIPIIQLIPEEKKPNNNSALFIHFILFYILYFLFFYSYLNNNKILLFCLVYSILLEVLQIFSNREFQLLDLIFNLLGVVFSYLFHALFQKKKKF